VFLNVKRAGLLLGSRYLISVPLVGFPSAAVAVKGKLFNGYLTLTAN
jgi:hypothetical protein